MTNPDYLTAVSYRKISLLRSLAHFNDLGKYPTMADLIRSDDGRKRLSIDMVSSRRVMIRNLIARGLVRAVSLEGPSRSQLWITDAGRANLTALGFTAGR